MSDERGLPLRPRIWSLNSLPTSKGSARIKLLWSRSSRSVVSSPISAGRFRSLLHDRSSWTRHVKRQISGGIRTRLLSFRYSEVRCCIFHRAGLRFLMVPARPKKQSLNYDWEYLTTWGSFTCYLKLHPLGLLASINLLHGHKGVWPPLVGWLILVFVPRHLANCWQKRHTAKTQQHSFEKVKEEQQSGYDTCQFPGKPWSFFSIATERSTKRSGKD